MPPTGDDVLKVCVEISEAENLQVTRNEYLTGALMVAMSTFAGSILNGPKGLLIGGILGSIGAASVAATSKQPVDEVINLDLSNWQRKHLANSVLEALCDFKPKDGAALREIALKDGSGRDRVVSTMRDFFWEEMGYTMAPR